jgi:hypothetical protein
MKKIFLTITALFVLCTACTKDGAKKIDSSSTNGLADAFGKANAADQFLINIYRQIVEVLPHTDNMGSRWGTGYLLDMGTENETGNGTTSGPVRDFNTGATTSASTGVFSYLDWKNNYGAIRSCLLYLAHINEVPADPQFNFSEDTRKIRIGEAKWLLAFNYAELCKQHGGLPIIKKVYEPTDAFDVPRSTYDETVAYIVGLCDEAAAVLPLKAVLDADYGRATKGAALALKARMLLYAASPLWNDSANPADTYLSGKYDLNKWEKAAQAAQDVIALGQYQLHTDISTLFTTRVNNEIIYSRLQQPFAYFTAVNVPYKLYPQGYALGGYNQVTYNMLKQYEVLKGGVAYPITDPASGYNLQDPFKNLDPRFYRDCIFNGDNILNQIVDVGELATGVVKTIKHNGQTTIPQYQSYLYNVKFCDLGLNVTTNDPRSGTGQIPTNQNYIYFRYGEVLLNYAEAVNEAYGPQTVPPGATMTALQAVNLVRTRAAYVAGKKEYQTYTGSMPPIPGGLSKDQFRIAVQHERRIELAFEEHYFWDVRRWKQTPETTVQALIPVWTSATVVSYQLRNIDTRYFNPLKSYRMPIPNSDILINNQLKQNPGW